MRLLKIDRWNPDSEIVARAAAILKNGGLVAFPTETVYGLGANGLSSEAVNKIFRAKGRPADNPLILHVADPARAGSLAEIDGRAADTIRAFWPGPLTLVLPARPHIPKEVTAGLPT
ncbi:MAG: L-threonylcarbamoyladenylate synthase, partial [Synergistaceae bacterium]|nr:L-threonylcarbamoyladenylate synthase [Synergistaceae bacterium]